jgi:hypothetical protein
VATTTRRGNHYPSGSDPVDVAGDIQTLAEDLDDAVGYDEGGIASRPTSSSGSPGVAGREYRSTDGTPISWKDIGTGWVPFAGPVGAFLAYLNDATFTLAASGTWTKVKLDAERFDKMSWFDTTNSRFVPQVAGVYRFSAFASLVDNLDDGNAFNVALYKNGSEVQRLGMDRAPSISPLGTGGSATVEANGSTDYFELYASQASSNTRRLLANATGTYLCGEFIG